MKKGVKAVQDFFIKAAMESVGRSSLVGVYDRAIPDEVLERYMEEKRKGGDSDGDE